MAFTIKTVLKPKRASNRSFQACPTLATAYSNRAFGLGIHMLKSGCVLKSTSTIWTVTQKYAFFSHALLSELPTRADHFATTLPDMILGQTIDMPKIDILSAFQNKKCFSAARWVYSFAISSMLNRKSRVRWTTSSLIADLEYLTHFGVIEVSADHNFYFYAKSYHTVRSDHNAGQSLAAQRFKIESKYAINVRQLIGIPSCGSNPKTRWMCCSALPDPTGPGRTEIIFECTIKSGPRRPKLGPEHWSPSKTMANTVMSEKLQLLWRSQKADKHLLGVSIACQRFLKYRGEVQYKYKRQHLVCELNRRHGCSSTLAMDIDTWLFDVLSDFWEVADTFLEFE